MENWSISDEVLWFRIREFFKKGILTENSFDAVNRILADIGKLDNKEAQNIFGSKRYPK